MGRHRLRWRWPECMRHPGRHRYSQGEFRGACTRKQRKPEDRINRRRFKRSRYRLPATQAQTSARNALSGSGLPFRHRGWSPGGSRGLCRDRHHAARVGTDRSTRRAAICIYYRSPCFTHLRELTSLADNAMRRSCVKGQPMYTQPDCNPLFRLGLRRCLPGLALCALELIICLSPGYVKGECRSTRRQFVTFCRRTKICQVFHSRGGR